MQFVQQTWSLLLLLTLWCCDRITAQQESNVTNATMVQPTMAAPMPMNQSQPSAASVWVTEGLVTDLSLPGAPNATLDVRYDGPLQVTLGNKLTPQQASAAPKVCLHNASFECDPPFALLMVDPDATSRQNPQFRSWLHWIVVNVNATEKLHEGDQAVPYNGPAPPKGSGPHRYVFLLYCQSGRRLQGSELAPEKRNNFNLTEFVNKTELGPPLAGNFFFAENP